MGYQTPNIDRDRSRRDRIHRLLRPAELHRRAGGLHHRPEPDPDRVDQGGGARRSHWPAAEDPTIADLLKPLGYVTGQFGRTISATATCFCPRIHGFDEFYGNLYHLNAEEEPEDPDYPSNRCSGSSLGRAACSIAGRRMSTIRPRIRAGGPGWVSRPSRTPAR